MLRRLAVAAAICAPGPAFAHGTLKGLDGFNSGFIHPFTEPSQVVLILGFGLFAGSFAVRRNETLALVFAASLALGLMVGNGQAMQVVEWASFALAGLAAGGAALLPARLFAAAVPLAVAAGLAAGMISAPEAGLLRDRLLTGAGTVVSINAAIIYLSALVHVLPGRIGQPWVPIAFRIIAAWTATIAVLMLALALRPAAV
jgi:hydrogenase/urease accessory protein HupE